MIYYRHTDLLLSLLRLAMWDDRKSFEALKPISDDEWGVAFHLAANHTVQGLAWEGICKLECNELPSQDLLCTWTTKATMIEQMSANMNSVLSSLMDLLHSHNLHPIVMKGQCVASLYAKPMLRESGDIDLYFPTKEEFNQSQLILGQGMYTADGCCRIRFKGVEVEIHSRLIDINNPFVNTEISRLLSEKPFVKIEVTPNLALTGVASEANLLLLSTHIMKHSFGRGIGLRQMCDLATACAHYKNSIDSNKMKVTSKRLGLVRWDRLVYSFLVQQLGMPQDYLPYSIRLSKSHALSKRILLSGNFGRMIYTSKSNSLILRKAITALSMLKNSFWTLSCSPIEAFFCFSRLSLGQFRR